VRAKERRLRRWERREQYSEEYRLREQHGLSPPGTPAGSSSEEEEESDRGQPPRDVESFAPVTTGRGGGCGVGARGGCGGTRHRAICGGAYEHRGGAGERHGGTGGCNSGAPKPSRKREWGFSNLR
jgi:hypothetical protein